jgi:aarF domain-containing kinase
MLHIVKHINDARYLDMTGKRLLDALAMFTASRAVASQHFGIRFQQLGVYSKTSTFAKAVKRQTDSAAQATLSSTVPLDSSVNAAPPKKASTSTFDQKAGQIRGSESVQNANASNRGAEGLQQDHHYRFEDSTVADTLPNQALDVQQEKAQRYPLPDGTIPTAQAAIGRVKTDREVCNQAPAAEPAKKPLEQSGFPSTSLTPESSCRSSILDPDAENSEQSGPSTKGARLLQRQAESQIPSTAAEPPGQEVYAVRGSLGEDGPDLDVGQERDTIYRTTGSTSPVLSALPRVKLPKNVGDVQGGDSHIKGNFNADVFYSSSDRAERAQTLQERGVEEPSEEMVNEIFHSPRVARILGSKGKFGTSKPKNSSVVPAERMRSEQGEREETAQVSGRLSDVATPSDRGEFEPAPSVKREKNGIANLAAEIAKDSGTTQEVSSSPDSRFRAMLIN